MRIDRVSWRDLQFVVQVVIGGPGIRGIDGESHWATHLVKSKSIAEFREVRGASRDVWDVGRRRRRRGKETKIDKKETKAKRRKKAKRIPHHMPGSFCSYDNAHKRQLTPFVDVCLSHVRTIRKGPMTFPP
jgi:hypothetical protein